MTPTTRPTAQQVFRVNPSSLCYCDECLTVDGPDDDACHSIHLVFVESGDDRIELFHFEEEGVFVVHGVIGSRHRGALLSEVRERQTITLLVSETDDKIRTGSQYPPKAQASNLRVEKSA